MNSRIGKLSLGISLTAVLLFSILISVGQYTGQAQLNTATEYHSLRDGGFSIDGHSVDLSNSLGFQTNQLEETIEVTPGVPVSGSCLESNGQISFPDEERTGRLCSIEYLIDIPENALGFLFTLDKSDLVDLTMVASDGVPLAEATGVFVSRFEGEEITNQEVLACFQCEVFQPGPWYIGIINYEDTPQDYTLDLSVTPIFLENGTPGRGTVPGVPEGFGGQVGFIDFRIDVGAENRSLRIEMESTTGGDVDLFVRFGTFVDVQQGGIITDYRAETIEPLEVIIIDENSDPPLEPGPYFMQVANRDPERQNYTMTATLDHQGDMQESVTLSTDPGDIVFTTMIGENPDAQSMQFSNNGESIARWNASADAPWLFLDITSGNLLGGSSVDLSVFVDTTDLQAGTHEGNITFVANGFDDLVVPVTLVIEDPNAQPDPVAGDFLAIVFASLEFTEPEAWDRNVVEGCVVYTNVSDASSAIQITLLDGTIESYDIAAGAEVIVCGDVVHFELI